MAAKQVRVQLNIEEDLSGIAKIRSALDEFNKVAVQGFGKTRSAIDELWKNGGAGLANLKQRVTELQKANLEAQQAVLGNTLAQAQLNKELQAGTTASSRHTSALKQLQDRQKSLAQEAKTALQIFRDARKALQEYLGGIFSWPSGTSISLPPDFGSGSAGAGMVYAHRSTNLASALGLPATTPIGNILGGWFSHGIGPISGNGLAAGGLLLGSLTVGSSNRIVSALGGMGSGALIGSSILPGIGTAVGAAIGGLVGLFTGGDGAAKVHDTQIQQRYEKQMFQVLDDFNHWRTDYATATQEENKLYQEMISQFQRSQSKNIPTIELNNILAQMAATQDERTKRQQLAAIAPVPEYAAGGWTGMGGPAILHPGEFVLTQQAVNRIGVSVLNGLNQASGSGAGAGPAPNVYIDPVDLNAVVEKAIPVILRKGGPASRALRG